MANAHKLVWSIPTTDPATALASPHWIGTGALIQEARETGREHQHGSVVIGPEPAGAIFFGKMSRKLR